MTTTPVTSISIGSAVVGNVDYQAEAVGRFTFLDMSWEDAARCARGQAGSIRRMLA